MITPVTLEDIQKAQRRIAGHLPITPLEHSRTLSNISGHRLFVKWDLKFATGSFKERGALNFLLQLPSESKRSGVCAASAGNHALALSYHADQLGIPCSIVMPKRAPLVKVETTRRLGAAVELIGENFDEAYEYAQQKAEKAGLCFVPGFDDCRIVAGQGVAALEILSQLEEDIDCIVVPIGGGGLAAGIAVAAKALSPKTEIIGVRSEWSVLAAEKAPTTIFRPTTIADGIAVKKLGQIPEQILREHLDREIVVTEREIADAIMMYLDHERTVVEGAGAAALAGLLGDTMLPKNSRAVVLACGCNIDLNVLSRLIDRAQFEREQLLRVRVSVPDRPGSLSLLAGEISACGANVLETFHERRSSRSPGSVDITFLLEVRSGDHKQEVMQRLEALSLRPAEV